jgi:hypothetical protein
MATFTKGMDVLISFPKEINVSFFNIGNKKLFEKLHEDVEGQMTRSHKNDVLLPYQGFGLSFDV